MSGAPRLPLTNFSKGEFAPELYARVDVPEYAAGAKRIRNFIIKATGGLVFRPGTRFAGEALTVDGPERMVPFIFSQNQAYIQHFSDYLMRLSANGGFVTEEDLKIVSITVGATSILEIPYHAMSVGDVLYLDGNVGMTELNGQYAEILAVIDANHIRVNIDSSSYAALTGSSGIVRVGAPPAPPPDPAPLPPPPDPPPPPPNTSDDDDIGGGFGGYYSKWHGG